ncbi:MAG: hypothetical protein K0S39_1445 [Paenibacillus sp.]|jgi:hypothetical protein|nr:hypothetical protein [Paenibacillus sp.]
MATIVLHKPTRKRYVLIGTGFGAYKAMMPSILGGSLFPREESQEIPVAAVSDSLGNITWLYTEELQVVEVDGKSIGSYFAADQNGTPAGSGKPSDMAEDLCPACQFRISADTRECPSCGLTLISEEPM